jgi:L-2-hydroxyglutarate oxidase
VNSQPPDVGVRSPTIVDLVVVGAGLVGLATARAFLEKRPHAHVVVLDKEQELALHQSGHNSGVVHAGLYYSPGSLKAELCREGRERLLRFADERGIPYRVCGKLVVALGEAELPRLAELARRGRENGIVGLRELDAGELLELEPNVAGIRALHVPETAVIDFRLVAAAYASDLRRSGAEIRLGREVTGIEARGGGTWVRAGGEAIAARQVAVCAGAQSDRLARLSGRDDGRFRIAPFRGGYFVLSRRAARLVSGLIYPVPDPSLPFVGVHFTRRIDDQVWAGPNAVPTLDREGYGRLSFSLRDARELLGYPGAWRLGRRHWRAGVAEIWRDASKRAALASMRRYLPALEPGDISPGPCGIRAQLLARDGSLVDDFVLEQRGDVLHVVNAPSPAATASLAIGSWIAARLLGEATA